MRSSVRATLVRIAALALIVAGTVYAARSLWQEYSNARGGSLGHKMDSYLPNLADLSPGLLKNAKEADRFLAYYQLVNDRFPGTPGVSEMLGFCHYYSGNREKARALYEQAAQAWPDSFVARYDLGVIHYLEGDTEKALGYFQQATDIPEVRALAYVMGARVFVQLRAVKKEGLVEVLAQVQQAYGDAKRFIRVCMAAQGKLKELEFLAARYDDLRRAWSENNGEPFSTDLIIR